MHLLHSYGQDELRTLYSRHVNVIPCKGEAKETSNLGAFEIET